jgi:hypothetical protein
MKSIFYKTVSIEGVDYVIPHEGKEIKKNKYWKKSDIGYFKFPSIFCIDKLTLSIPPDYINTETFYNNKGMKSINTKILRNGWGQIYIQEEFINPYAPIGWPILRAVQILLLRGCFKIPVQDIKMFFDEIGPCEIIPLLFILLTRARLTLVEVAMDVPIEQVNIEFLMNSCGLTPGTPEESQNKLITLYGPRYKGRRSPFTVYPRSENLHNKGIDPIEIYGRDGIVRFEHRANKYQLQNILPINCRLGAFSTKNIDDFMFPVWLSMPSQYFMYTFLHHLQDSMAENLRRPDEKFDMNNIFLDLPKDSTIHWFFERYRMELKTKKQRVRSYA